MSKPSKEEVSSLFDKYSETFDERPFSKVISKLFVEVIENLDLLKPEYECLEFGVGTGNFPFHIIDKVKHIHGVDSSEGMLDKFKSKIEKSHYEDKLSYECVFLEKPNQLERQFDCVYAQLTVHHVEDLNSLFNILSSHLKPGGLFFLSEFEKSDISHLFHSDPTTVFHPGMIAEDIKKYMENNGIKACEPVRFRIDKESTLENGEKKTMNHGMIFFYGYKNN